mgnify:CR=1 FL=1
MGGSRCLDCFAGSGALGFEAASRGAHSVVMIEADRQAYQFLSNNADLLQADRCELVQERVEHYLRSAQTPFDVVFLDPPYQANSWSDIANMLTNRGLLSEGALIYLEYPRRETQPALPQSWHCVKEKHAGDVKYALFEFHSGASE